MATADAAAPGGDDLLAAWQKAGIDELMLPTGTEVRVMLPGPGAMARLGVTPGVLRSIVGRLTGDLAQGGMSDEDWTRYEGAIRSLICEAVVEVRPPGHEAFTAWTIQPEDLAERRLPPVDSDALVQLVMRLESPERIDARSRAATGAVPVAVAARAMARSRVTTLPEWMEFVKGDEGLMCAMTARTFGQRPSVLLGIEDPMVAYALDEALALRLALLRPGRKQPLAPEFYEHPELPEHDSAIADEVHRAHLERLRAEGRLKAETSH